MSLRLALPGPVILAGGVLVHQPLLRRLLDDRLATIGTSDLGCWTPTRLLGAVRLAGDLVPIWL